jgi:hypothetical protein
MKQRVRDLIAQGDRMFSDRSGIMSLWQAIAEHFCPIRADFVARPALGHEFASHLMTGRPVLAHRDLGNALSSMLRPRGVRWFHARTMDEALNASSEPKAYLDHIADVMWRAMYDTRAGFVRATKQGDLDYVAFGQTVITIEPNRMLDGLLVRNWHLRDIAFAENEELKVDTIHHKWLREARALARMFPDKIAANVKTIAGKEPFKKVNCRQIVIPEDEYDLGVEKKGRHGRMPFCSILIDVDHETILEEVPQPRLWYVIPRWQTVSGSPYAYSPAAVAALPDARMLQAMTLTLLEAGQKRVDPPLKATKDAVIGSVNQYAGAITWVDGEYDERLGPAIEPLIRDAGDLRWGELREDKIERMISEAFYLNVINLPEAARGEKMTATETAERVKEYIRRALPLFEPIEVEYNAGLCELVFETANALGMFGAFDDMPQALRRQNIVWQFDSPLQSATERVKSEQFAQSAALLAQAARIDPLVAHDFDVDIAFREALAGVAPAKWIKPDKVAAAGKQQAQKVQQAAATAQAVATGADVATRVGTAVQTAGEAAKVVHEAGVEA